jgi:lysozyme
VRDAEQAVGRRVKVALTQAQFDALVSYTFSRGAHGASGAYELINAQNFAGAAKEISSKTGVRMKNKAGKFVHVVAPGLIARRAEESAPFRNSVADAARNTTK